MTYFNGVGLQLILARAGLGLVTAQLNLVSVQSLYGTLVGVGRTVL